MNKCTKVLLLAPLLFSFINLLSSQVPCEYSKRNYLLESHLMYDVFINDCNCNESNYSPMINARETENVVELLWMDVFDPDVSEVIEPLDHFLYSIYHCDLPYSIANGFVYENRSDLYYLANCNPDSTIVNDTISPIQISIDSEFSDAGIFDLITLNVGITKYGEVPDSLYFNAYLVKKENTFGFYGPPYSDLLVCDDTVREESAKNFVIDEFNSFQASDYMTFSSDYLFFNSYNLIIPDSAVLSDYAVVSIVYNEDGIINTLQSELLEEATTGYFLTCEDAVEVEEPPCIYSRRTHLVEKLIDYDVFGVTQCGCNEAHYQEIWNLRYTNSNFVDLLWLNVWDGTWDSSQDTASNEILYSVHQCTPHDSYDYYVPAVNRIPSWDLVILDCDPYVEIENDTISSILISTENSYNETFNTLLLDIEIEVLAPLDEDLQVLSYLVKKEDTYGYYILEDEMVNCNGDTEEGSIARNLVIDDFYTSWQGFTVNAEPGTYSGLSSLIVDSLIEASDYMAVTLVYSEDEVYNILESELIGSYTTGYYDCSDTLATDTLTSPADTLVMDTTSIDTLTSILEPLEIPEWTAYIDPLSQSIILNAAEVAEPLYLFNSVGKLLKMIYPYESEISISEFSDGLLLISDGKGETVKLIKY